MATTFCAAWQTRLPGLLSSSRRCSVLEALIVAVILGALAAYALTPRLSCGQVAQIAELVDGETTITCASPEAAVADLREFASSPSELGEPPLASAHSPPPRLPKIFHQIYENLDDPGRPYLVPEPDAGFMRRWRAKLAPEGWLHVVWLFDDIRAFMRRHATSEDLALWESWPYDIQRLDMVRYYILHRYGGVYADIDLEPLLGNFSAHVLTKCSPEGGGVCVVDSPHKDWEDVNNNLMVATPGHRLLEIAMETLRERRPRLGLRARNVLDSTGPVLLGEAARRYDAEADELRQGAAAAPALAAPPARPGHPKLVRLDAERFYLGLPTGQGQAMCRHRGARSWDWSRTRDEIRFDCALVLLGAVSAAVARYFAFALCHSWKTTSRGGATEASGATPDGINACVDEFARRRLTSGRGT